MRKIRIILIQLLTNAIKFTTAGQIDIQARVQPSAGGTPSMLVVTVRDTGIGIAPHKLPTLFEQFALNDDVTASKFGGSGLGLALSRRLCRLLGGELVVEAIDV